MARWQPGAADRLQQAAMELFTARGYDATTVADIAARAAVTERTFFRHFADKREVLFQGEDTFRTPFVEAIATAPPATGTPALVAASVEAACRSLQDLRGRDQARARNAVVAANESLRERELLKLAALTRAIAEAFAGRGLSARRSRLAADLVVSVFATACDEWVTGTGDDDLVRLQRLALADVGDLIDR